VDGADEVGPVVDRDLRARGREGGDVRRVGVGVLAAAGADLDPLLGERGHDVVLGGQRVRRAQGRLRAAGHERAHEAGRLGGDMQARGHPNPVERTLRGQALADRAQDGHLPVRPLDPCPALGSEARVGYV
jgi:hypothetical protein